MAIASHLLRRTLRQRLTLEEVSDKNWDAGKREVENSHNKSALWRNFIIVAGRCDRRVASQAVTPPCQGGNAGC
jgi:hypothetical protein